MQQIAITQLSPEDLKTLFKELLEQEISPLKDASAKKLVIHYSQEKRLQSALKSIYQLYIDGQNKVRYLPMLLELESTLKSHQFKKPLLKLSLKRIGYDRLYQAFF